MVIGGIIQSVIAVALVILLCVVAFLVYNAEMMSSIRESSRIRRSTPIFEGVKDLQASFNEEYNTVDPSNPLYRKLDNSLNQKAGAEYTYNFWLFVASGQNWGRATNPVYNTDSGMTKLNEKRNVNIEKPLVLFNRGTNIAVPYRSICTKNVSDLSDVQNYKIDVLVKQPLVKLERNGDVMVVELNTQKHPDGIKEKSRDTCSDNNTNWESVNSYRLAVKGFTDSGMAGKWNMITLVVQDTFPSDPLPLRNKVRVRLYVNGALEMDRYVDGKLADATGEASTVRMNSGNFYFAPVIKLINTQTKLSYDLNALGNAYLNKVMMADLTYFNYAIDEAERNALFASGFKTEYAPSLTVNPLSVTYGNEASGFDTTKNQASSERMLDEIGSK